MVEVQNVNTIAERLGRANSDTVTGLSNSLSGVLRSMIEGNRFEEGQFVAIEASAEAVARRKGKATHHLHVESVVRDGGQTLSFCGI